MPSARLRKQAGERERESRGGQAGWQQDAASEGCRTDGRSRIERREGRENRSAAALPAAAAAAAAASAAEGTTTTARDSSSTGGSAAALRRCSSSQRHPRRRRRRRSRRRRALAENQQVFAASFSPLACLALLLRSFSPLLSAGEQLETGAAKQTLHVYDGTRCGSNTATHQISRHHHVRVLDKDRRQPGSHSSNQRVSAAAVLSASDRDAGQGDASCRPVVAWRTEGHPRRQSSRGMRLRRRSGDPRQVQV